MPGSGQINSYSVFLIQKGKIPTLKKELKKNHLKPTIRKQITHNTFTFYFSDKPPDTPVRWMELYKEFLPGVAQKFNRVFFGVLLIEMKEHHTFAISLGKAHFYIDKYCDPNFGLDLAQRIANPSELKSKITKYLFSNKNHSLITFRQSSNIDDYESGEFFQHVTASTISELNWGKQVTFGENVLFKMPLQPSELSSLLKNINAALKKNIRVDIPRVEIVKDNTQITSLEKRLVKALKHAATSPASGEIVLTSKGSLLSETNNCFVYQTGYKREMEQLANFDMESLANFAARNNISLDRELEQLHIIIEREDDLPTNYPLKYCLDYSDDKGNCLLTGKWYKFNTAYIDFLKQSVDRIGFEHDPKQDLSNSALKKYLTAHPDHYAEQYFNFLREKGGYINKDREIILLDGKYRIEYMDLYLDKCLFFVKIGIPQKLSYVIDQANNTLNLLKNKQIKIKIKNRLVRPKQICLWLILDRSNRINNLSEINSLIFHAKLTEWIRLCKGLHITPIVRINYRIP